MEFIEETGIPETKKEADWMSQVREEEGTKPLPEEKYKEFLHVVSQLRFFSTRAWGDTQTAI